MLLEHNISILQLFLNDFDTGD